MVANVPGWPFVVFWSTNVQQSAGFDTSGQS
jgi:hypothetical protein